MLLKVNAIITRFFMALSRLRIVDLLCAARNFFSVVLLCVDNIDKIYVSYNSFVWLIVTFFEHIIYESLKFLNYYWKKRTKMSAVFSILFFFDIAFDISFLNIATKVDLSLQMLKLTKLKRKLFIFNYK